MENHLKYMLNQGPIIKNYSPVSSKGGTKKKSKRFRTRKNKTNKSRTKRRYH
jgi:hypothetical protein